MDLRRGSWRRARAPVVGVLLLVAALFLDCGFLVRPRLERAARDLEEVLGRPVRIGAARLRLLPRPFLTVEELSIGPAPAEGPGRPPLLRLRALRVRPALLAWVRSGGAEVPLRELEMEGLEIALARLPDGRLSHEEVLAKLRGRRRPLTAEQRERLTRLHIGALELRGGALRCQAAGGEAAVTDVSLRGADLRLGAPLSLTLDAAVFGGGRNLHLDAALTAPPPDLEVEEPVALLRRAALRLSTMELAPLGCLTGTAPPGRLEAAEISVVLPAEAGRLALRGEAHLSGFPQGELRLRADVEGDPIGGDLRIGALDASLGAMRVVGNADLRRLWTAPEIHALRLESRGLRLESLGDLGAPLPGPPRGLRGPVQISLFASGPPRRARLQATLDLTGALRWLPRLREESPLPMAATVRAALTEEGLAVERLALRLGVLELPFTGRLIGARLSLRTLPVEVDRAALEEAMPLLAPGLLRWRTQGRRLRPDGSFQVDLRRGLALDGTLRLQRDGPVLHLSGTLLHPEVRPPERPPPGPLGERLRRSLPRR